MMKVQKPQGILNHRTGRNKEPPRFLAKSDLGLADAVGVAADLRRRNAGRLAFTRLERLVYRR